MTAKINDIDDIGELNDVLLREYAMWIESLGVLLQKTRKLIPAASEGQRPKLRRIESFLEMWRSRYSICSDILAGRAFLIHTVDGDLVITSPDERTAKIIDAAEKHGAKVTSVEVKSSQEQLL